MVKMLMIWYMVINMPSIYNIILGQLMTNMLGGIVLTTHLKVKFPMDDWSVNVIIVNQAITPKCYEDNLKAKRGLYEPTKQYGVHFMELDPWRKFMDRCLMLVEEVKEVEIEEGNKVKINMILTPQLEADIFSVPIPKICLDWQVRSDL